MYRKKVALSSANMDVVRYILLVMSMCRNLEPEGLVRLRCRKTGSH